MTARFNRDFKRMQNRVATGQVIVGVFIALVFILTVYVSYVELTTFNEFDIRVNGRETVVTRERHHGSSDNRMSGYETSTTHRYVYATCLNSGIGLTFECSKPGDYALAEKGKDFHVWTQGRSTLWITRMKRLE